MPTSLPLGSPGAGCTTMTTFPCDGCQTKTPWRLLDGKPSARAMAAHGTLDAALSANSEIDRFLCEACYGPGWSASTKYAPS